MSMCVHGMVGSCPDCPPDRMHVCDGDTNGAPTAIVKGRDWPWVVVQRHRADGSFDWFTWHMTHWGARRAARLYERTGKVKGIRP